MTGKIVWEFVWKYSMRGMVLWGKAAQKMSSSKVASSFVKNKHVYATLLLENFLRTGWAIYTLLSLEVI